MVLEWLARGIGAFYVLGAFFVLWNLRRAFFLEAAAAQLSHPAPDRLGLIRNWLLLGGALLTLSSGAAVAFLSRLAVPLFVAGALWQGAYLLWARHYLPSSDASEARGRRQTTNAAILYLLATAFVLWLWLRGVLA